MPRQAHQQLFDPVEVEFRILIANLELLADLVVEVLKQFLSSLAHRLANFAAELELQLVERGSDLVRLPALLTDGTDPLLKVHTGPNGTEHFVARTEYTFEK